MPRHIARINIGIMEQPRGTGVLVLAAGHLDHKISWGAQIEAHAAAVDPILEGVGNMLVVLPEALLQAPPP
jgi:hypothetical protein